LRAIEYNFTVRIPAWLDYFLALPVVLYRRFRFGYTFRRIPLTKGKYAIVDVDDYYWLRLFKWFTSKNGYTFYAKRSVYSRGKSRGQTLAMHRMIMNAPDNLLVDHINHNGLDNRKANLRLATPAQNNRNCLIIKKRDAHSRYRGVTWSKRKNRWLVTIRYDGGRKFLGYFRDEIQAAETYDMAAKVYHGQFASLNFPLSPRRRGC